MVLFIDLPDTAMVAADLRRRDKVEPIGCLHGKLRSGDRLGSWRKSCGREKNDSSNRLHPYV